MILGTGIDIEKVARFTDMTPRFAMRVFAEGERAYIGFAEEAEQRAAIARPASAAGLFAVKEAVAKALGTGFSGFWPCDIEVYHDKRGKPKVRLHGGAARAARRLARGRGRMSIHVSISHTDTDAVASAVIERM